jgi:hypothetical protein
MLNLRRIDRGLLYLDEGKKGGVLHHLPRIVQSAQSAPSVPFCSERFKRPSLDRARAMPFHEMIPLEQRGQIFRSIKGL